MIHVKNTSRKKFSCIQIHMTHYSSFRNRYEKWILITCILVLLRINAEVEGLSCPRPSKNDAHQKLKLHGQIQLQDQQMKVRQRSDDAAAPPTNEEMGRSSFLKSAITKPFVALTVIAVGKPSMTKAIEFVPASPSFSGSYQDAVEILYTQRLAIDNIGAVISDGKLDEAGFKVMQLSAQTRTAGKIILDTLQQKISGSESITLLRYLSCQKKFAVLLDLCDECGTCLQDALKGKLGATAAAQIKSMAVVDNTKIAYDDFLTEVTQI